MDRRTFAGGVALTFSQVATPAVARAFAANADAPVIRRRYAAPGEGHHPSVLLLHGLRGFQRKLAAYERYANALTVEGIDAYLVEFYAPVDEVLRTMNSREKREAYERQRYGAWSERVSSAVTTVLESGHGSDCIGLLGFSLGGFVAAMTAARDSRVSALAVLYGGMPDAVATHVTRMPPVIELHGDADHNVPPAAGKALVTLAKAVGASAEQIIYPGKGHGFDFADDDLAASDAVGRVARFFKVQFGGA